jgi:hypothetical protein
MPIFEVFGSSDPLDQWDTHPQMEYFGVGEVDTPETIEPIYRVNLSDNIAAANSALAEKQASFERIKAALEEVPFRLNGLVRWVHGKQPKAGSGVAFSLADLQPEPDLEGELLSWLAITDSVALSGSGPQGVSFGLLAEASMVLGHAKENFESLLEQVNREALQFVWVEMKMADQLVARTKMGWNGSHTNWINAISAEQMSLHKRTLRVVSLTRNLRLRLVLIVAIGAVKLAPLLIAPGGTELAVPAVFGYVNNILKYVAQLHSIQSS